MQTKVCVRSGFARHPSAKDKTAAPPPTVAIYHLSVKTIGRSAGRSATAAAAYRAGCRIKDERTGDVFDYRRKRGIESSDLVLPDGAPSWALDRAAVWNAAELSERRKNSTVAREFEVALPMELSASQRQRLALDFAGEIVARHGCLADVSIHAPGKEGDNRNHHAHILVSTRRLESGGFTAKTRELDDQKSGEVDRWRARFAELQNERLQEVGAAERVDHRTLEAQGIEREPTRHLGPAAAGIERRTGLPSRKREEYQREATERLARAKEAGELERQAQAVDRSILDLSGDIEKAKATRALNSLPTGDPPPIHPGSAVPGGPSELQKRIEESLAKSRQQLELKRRSDAGLTQAQEAFERMGQAQGPPVISKSGSGIAPPGRDDPSVPAPLPAPKRDRDRDGPSR